MDNTIQLVDGQLADSPVAIDESPNETLLEDELLVEEISIDGMCGVY